jgi:beta-glucosidase
MSRVEELIARMTLAEKLGQLTMVASSYAVTGPVLVGDSTEGIKSGAIGNLLNMVGYEHVREVQTLAVKESRLGIPLLIGLDILHGHHTLFPIPLGEAAIFDEEVWASTAREAAIEAAGDGLALTFAPMLDVARDPRWGRTAEGPGEDPLVGARMAAAKVRGFQGADLGHADSLAAVAKHFCGYGAVTAGREYASADISERTVHEVYLPPFAAAVAAGVAAIMPAFNDIAGVPMTCNKALLHDWLRVQQGFDGVIITDYHAIAELINQGVAGDLAQAAAHALNSGVDVDMMSDAYRRGLPDALERGLVTMAQIDTAVRRVLKLKERLGLFEDPYRRGKSKQTRPALEHRRRLARAVAAKSIVMLKNEAATLPLSPDIKRVALIGPLADAAAEMRGPWWGASAVTGHVTPLEGLRQLPGIEIAHAMGVDIGSDDVSGISAALDACAGADMVVLCLGEAAVMSGEASSRAHIGLPGRQRELAEAVMARAREIHVPVVAVVFSGRPLVIDWLADTAQALLAAWFLGSEAGNAIADVLSGHVSPSGRTPMTWPRAAGQVPIFFGQRPSGRPFDPQDRFTTKYIDVANEPLFPFGFGLTYGRFEWKGLRLSTDTLGPKDTLNVSIDIQNHGLHAAEETAFLFVHYAVSSVSQPILTLKGFAKIRLRSGESGTVQMSVAAADLRILGLDLQPIFESGEVQILVGPNADRSQLLAAPLRLVWTCAC